MNSHTKTQALTQPHGAVHTSGRVRKHSHRHTHVFRHCSSHSHKYKPAHVLALHARADTDADKDTNTDIDTDTTPTQTLEQTPKWTREQTQTQTQTYKQAQTLAMQARTCDAYPLAHLLAPVACTRAPARVHAYTHARAHIDLQKSSGKRRRWRMAQHALRDVYAITQTATIFADDNSTNSLRAEAPRTTSKCSHEDGNLVPSWRCAPKS